MDELKALHRSLLEALALGKDVTSFEPWFSPRHHFEQSLLDDVPPGFEGVRALRDAQRRIFSEGYARVEQQIARPGAVYTRIVGQMKLRGPVGRVIVFPQWIQTRALALSTIEDGLFMRTSIETNLYSVVNYLQALQIEPTTVLVGASEASS